MKYNSRLILFLPYFVLSICCIAISAVPTDSFLGISPHDENYYKISSNGIKCKDGSKIFSKAQLNDDFCDCPDGTDEPGTPACPTGKFYCRNAGHIPVLLFSSRVNDGICDCCDGSDEYDGQVKCQNTCWEAGKMARDRLRKKISTYKEGVALRNQEIEMAKLAISKDEAELSKLKNEESILKGLVEQLKERKEQIEKAEEHERLQKEKEEKEKRETEEKAKSGESEIVEETIKEKRDVVEVNSEDESLKSIIDHKIGVSDDSSLAQDKAGADAELCDHSKNEGSLVHKLEQHVLKEEHSVSPKSMADTGQSDASIVQGSSLNEMEQDVAREKEDSISPKIKESVVISETGHDAGEVAADQTVKLDNHVSENTEGLSKEELGRLIASRWTGKSEKPADEVDVTKDSDHEDHELHAEMPAGTHDGESDGYASGTDDDPEKYESDRGQYDDIDPEDDLDETYEDDLHNDAGSSYKSDPEDDVDFSDTTFASNPSWLEKIQRTVRNLLQAVNFFKTPVDQSEAARVRKEYEESSAKLTKIQSRISSLSQKLKHDYGTEKEFYAFYDQCFESKENKYVYKVCPFKQASQVEGHSTTRLGRWEKFEDSYQVMIFSNGDKCWNGPDRSLKVKLRCGSKNEITDVDEPSRCEYVAILSTPSLCLQEKLKELESELDLMNKELPQNHDEL